MTIREHMLRQYTRTHTHITHDPRADYLDAINDSCSVLSFD